MAQVGVLEELTAAGIRIDCVAGTSAGAVIGAAYAADLLEDFSRAMCALTRGSVLWLFDPKWPRLGLLEGRRAMALVRPFVGGLIETMPRRFAAVATDLTSGAEVALRRGESIEAIRASIAIPGIFTPQRVGDRLLVDGGLVNPIPSSVVRALGAEFTIAVSVLPLSAHEFGRRTAGSREPRPSALQRFARFLGSAEGSPAMADPLPDRRGGEAQGDVEEEIGLTEILLQASRVVQSHIARSRLREQPPDILIHVPLPRIGLFELHRSQEMVEAGRAAARRALPQLRAALDGHRSVSGRMRRWLQSAAQPR